MTDAGTKTFPSTRSAVLSLPRKFKMLSFQLRTKDYLALYLLGKSHRRDKELAFLRIHSRRGKYGTRDVQDSCFLWLAVLVLASDHAGAAVAMRTSRRSHGQPAKGNTNDL